MSDEQTTEEPTQPTASEVLGQWDKMREAKIKHLDQMTERRTFLVGKKKEIEDELQNIEFEVVSLRAEIMSGDRMAKAFRESK